MKWNEKWKAATILLLFSLGVLTSCTDTSKPLPAETSPSAQTTQQAKNPLTQAPKVTSTTAITPAPTQAAAKGAAFAQKKTTAPKAKTTAAKIKTTTKKVSRTVYITRTGKRYHYSSHCNGGTYYASTLDKAKAQGLTPCKKCAG